MEFVIIGNGTAGVTAARTIAAAAPEGSTVHQFTDEQFPHYSRPKLPSFIGDPTATKADVLIYDRDWYRRQNIELHLNEKVERINPKEQVIITQSGTYPFSRLLLATGASCYVPSIKGMPITNFFTIRTLEEAIKVRNQLAAPTTESVVVIGGGLLGLEIAHACSKQGKPIHVVEYFPYLLPRQLDSEGAVLLQEIFEDQGMQFHLGTTVERVLGDKKVEGVQLANGSELPADMTLTCSGIVPNKALAEKAGIACNRGILVDDYLETNRGGIYAAGDAAEHNGILYGLWSISQEQARVAAANMLKPKSHQYLGSKIGTTLKVANIYLTSLGSVSSKETATMEIRKFRNEQTKEFVKLFLNEDRIQGAIILGTKKGIPLIRKLFLRNETINSFRKEINNLFPNLV
ncbi:MAG: NAD(P)/FAD-dependent oxidoreductase [Candidatus Hodarchaeota archaeon]